MKTISKLLTFIFISIFILSCSISEEITFNTNGSINYSFLMDGSSFMKMAPDSVSQDQKKVRDSVITFSTFLEEKKDSIAKLPKETQKQLEALKPFIIKMHEDQNKKEFYVQLNGDFTNSSSLNSALAALNSFDSKDKNTNKLEKMEFLVPTVFEWNGNKLTKKSSVSEAMKTDSSAQSILTMFSGGKFKAKYNFPKKVKKVSNPSALISQDGKSVIIEYDAADYLTSPEKTNLEVELEK